MAEPGSVLDWMLDSDPSILAGVARSCRCAGPWRRSRSTAGWRRAGSRSSPAFFTGEAEPCINGMTVALGAYFGQDVDGVVARLLGEQLEDGDGRPSRWNTLRALRVLSWYGRPAG